MPAQVQKAGRRQEQKARTREAIILAARELFHRDGYEAVTVRQVAKAAALSTGSIFAGFAGKADLFKAAMGHPAPDVGAFLRRVAIAAADETVAQLGNTHPFTEIGEEAARLHSYLLGHNA